MGEMKIVAVKDAVYKIQSALLDGIGEEERVMLAGSLMCRGDYEDVVTERNIVNICGYPLCRNKLPSEKTRKGRYRVSLKEHKVYDLEETDKYCSASCVVNSRAFAISLQEERSSDLNPEKIENVLKKFEGLNLRSESEGTSETGNLGSSELKIQENIEYNGGSMSMGNRAGPSYAIEGYVPRKDRSSQSSQFGKQKKATQKAKESSFFNDMNFTSCIITGDEYTISKMPPFEMDVDHQFTVFDSSSHPSKRNVETNKEGSKFRMNQTLIKDEQVAIEVGTSLITVPAKAVKEASADDISKLCKSMRKSSLKSSGSLKQTRSVTWADEQVDDCGKGSLCEVEKQENVDGSVVYDESNVSRSASAEASAIALNQASEAVASGEADVTDTDVNSHQSTRCRFLSIGSWSCNLPPDHDEGEAVVNNGVVELDTTAVKWPKKHEISEADILESADSWLDTPPDGFSLSYFRGQLHRLWLIYTGKTNAHMKTTRPLMVKNILITHKITLSDGRPSEIKQALAGSLSRALPGLVAELRLHVPVSNMEKELGLLLEIMTFIDALPSLRMKQWQLITLLLLDALSVYRIPALQPIMTSQRILLHKVFENAQIGAEEYEVMKDHMIPLGRTPQFSAQSGA